MDTKLLQFYFFKMIFDNFAKTNKILIVIPENLTPSFYKCQAKSITILFKNIYIWQFC